jgi:2'-5' RNA ligase
MVVALVADAEPLVGRHRDRLDPTTGRGLGAHVTLVYPFVDPARITDATVRDLRAALAEVAPFACAFSALRWFSDRVLWLAPDPVTPFVEIADRIVRDVPGCPPPQRDLVPHLTVGLRRHASGADLRAAEQEMTPALPLMTRIDAVQVMVRAATWETVAEVRLGGPS